MPSLQVRRFAGAVNAVIFRLVQLLLHFSLLHQDKQQVNARPTGTGLPFDRIPADSWDSHIHVIDPVKYPLAEDAQYTPKTHNLSEALKFETSVGLRNVVLIQPSIYGIDNTCMLDALRMLGPHHARAVVTFDPETIQPSTLQLWHQWGVRGVRVNTQSIGKQISEGELVTTLQKYADIIRPYNWVLQLYVPLDTAIILEKIVPELGVTVCLDHFGSPALNESSYNGDPYSLPGFQSLVNLLLEGNTYVKLSAPYRISEDEEWRDLEPVAKELVRVAGMNRTVFASDWPHTRFEGLDIKPYIKALIDWCGNDVALIGRVFRGNSEALWGIQPAA